MEISRRKNEMSKRNLLYVGLMTVAVMAITACSKIDQLKVDAASSAMQAANAAEAELYAGDALSSARALLTEAESMKKAQDEKFALLRSYKEVDAKYEAAKAAFETAKNAAVEGKAAKKAEAEQKLAAAAAALDAAEAKLKEAPKTKDSKADLEAWGTDIAAWRQGLADAQGMMAGEKYLDIISKVDAITSSANSVVTQIDEVIAKKGRK
jgi:hypothetical protein